MEFDYNYSPRRKDRATLWSGSSSRKRSPVYEKCEDRNGSFWRKKWAIYHNGI
jgi:hypothetical protein